MEDAVKKRQDYLRKRAVANTLQLVGAVTTIGCGLIWLLSLVGIIAGVSASLSLLPALLGAGLLALPSLGAATLLASGFWHSSAEAAKSIPYVPPVHEQLAALPADEVLLRGSRQPAAAPDELLRAADPVPVVSHRELLRPQPGRPELAVVEIASVGTQRPAY